MSTIQVLRQLENLADNLTWTASPNKRVFANQSVIYTALQISDIFAHLNFPFCIFQFLDSTGGSEMPGYKTIRFRASIGAKHEGDRLGRMLLSGGRQSSTTGDSTGKGVLQLKTELSQQLRLLTRNNGILHQVKETNEAVGGTVIESVPVAIIEVDYTCLAFEEDFYADVYNLQGTVSGGDVTLTWNDPPARYDRIATGSIVIRRKLNSNPTSETDGTAVATKDIGDETHTDTGPGSGAWHYAIFVGYDETTETPTTAEAYSNGRFKRLVV